MLMQGFAVAGTPENLMIALIGCFIGTVVGLLPGLGPINGVAILLPIDRILDTVRTAVNVEGDMIGSLIVQRLAAVPAGTETVRGS